MESWRQELYSSELYHHGIMGQKWGVRRYQNYDGTRTELGKKRYINYYSNEKYGYKFTKKGKEKLTKHANEYAKTGWAVAYNKAADKMNSEIIPQINKKYKDIDFTDPNNRESYRSYLQEYNQIFQKAYSDAVKETFFDVLVKDFGSQFVKEYEEDSLEEILNNSPAYNDIERHMKEEGF